MVRSVSPLDFSLALKVLHTIKKYPGLNKKEIANLIDINEKNTKLDSAITDFNENHLNLVRREKNKYYLNIPKEKIPSENSFQDIKIQFWREYFLNFPLYIEILQSFSFGNSIKSVSGFTGVSIVSTQALASWAEIVGDLENIGKETYKISIRSIEELLNRICVCQLGLLGCSIIEREKQLEESGMRVDVYGFDKKNKKNYYIESESSASKLNEGIMQAHMWVSSNKKNIEKWVVIPKGTLKEVTFNTLIKRYNSAKNRSILIKLCDLEYNRWSKITNLEIPRAKDMEIFNKLLIILKAKSFINLDEISNLTKNHEAFLERIRRFGLLIKKANNSYYPTFKI